MILVTKVYCFFYSLKNYIFIVEFPIRFIGGVTFTHESEYGLASWFQNAHHFVDHSLRIADALVHSVAECRVVRVIRQGAIADVS